MATPTSIPALSEIGDTFAFSETFTAYPADAYTITLYLNLNGTAATNVAGTNSTLTTWDFSIPKTATANLTAGLYDYAFYATKTADNTRSTAKTGQLQFIPNLAATVTKSEAQLILDALNATILSLSASGNQSVSFNGQSYSKRDMMQLMQMRRELEAQVFREQREAANLRGVVDDGNIGVRFNPGAGAYPFGFPWGPVRQ